MWRSGRRLSPPAPAHFLRRFAQRVRSFPAPMQQFAWVKSPEQDAVYMPLHGFTALDLGYQPGNAVSSFINQIDEPTATSVNGGVKVGQWME